MLDLAKHIVNQKTADLEPAKFEDHYEEALTELINARAARRQRRQPYGRAQAEHRCRGVKQSQEAAEGGRRANGMLLPIEGKRRAEKKAAKPERTSCPRKAG